MKIDRSKLKKSSSELPEACRLLIEKLKGCKDNESLLLELTTVRSWDYGKSELFHWVDVLDLLDDVMEKAVVPQNNKWALACDDPANVQLKELLLQVIRFTSLLIEHSFQRYFYYSMEHLISLLSSSDMNVVLEVLNVLYVFSKRSNFITRLGSEKKAEIMQHLNYLAESWGGKENGFGLADCCRDVTLSNFPPSATTLHFEFYAEDQAESAQTKSQTHSSSQPHASNQLCTIHMENVHEVAPTPADVMHFVLTQHAVPRDKQTLLFTHCRLAHSFASYEKRLKCVLARLQAISVLVYSNAVTSDNSHQVIYSGFINELVDVLELAEESLVEMKAAVLRTLTSILHLERNPKLEVIIECTGANSYHGFLPCLARRCIQHMVEPHLTPMPHMYSTALFSFLYHLASYENGGEALLTCGVMVSLLKLIGWLRDQHEHITFVTRAVRIVDLITNIDASSFETHNGMAVFIQRLQHEVDICRKEQPFVIRPNRAHAPAEPMSVDQDGVVDMCNDNLVEGALSAAEDAGRSPTDIPYASSRRGLQCLPQRAALLKSILNFLKKAIPDPSLSESIRHLMDGDFPKSLKHIISNAEYYGPSLLLLGMDVVTVFVFQEPSLLSSLQEKGLTDVILHALLVKDVPATREVLAALPNVFSALCLNSRGLEAFVEYKPFDKLFQVLLSPEYLPAMKRRKHSLTLADTASNLGTAMDELMRHQPALRSEAIKAIVGLLKEILRLGQDPNCVCQSAKAEALAALPNVVSSPATHSGDIVSSDDDDEESSNISVVGTPRSRSRTGNDSATAASSVEPEQVPLMDYILNVMKFVDAIMSNNTTDDHCKEFIAQGGLTPIMEILRLPNLPLDFPSSPACQAVSSVCTVLLKLCHEQKVLKEGLEQLEKVLDTLDPLYKPLPPPGGSSLLHELANGTQIATGNGGVSVSGASYTSCEPSPRNTPMLYALSATHAYVKMFVHACRLGQSEIRAISVNQWGSELGQRVLKSLSKLYLQLVWESTLLLAFYNDDAGEMLPPNSEFGKADLQKLLPKDAPDSERKELSDIENSCSVGVTAAMESLTTSENLIQAMELDEVADEDAAKGEVVLKKKKLTPTQQMLLKHLKPLLNVSSRLGGTLPELFGVLVKLCVGSPLRQRRTHQSANPIPTVPSVAARAVTNALCQLAKSGISWQPPTDEPLTRIRLTILMCSVNFTNSMLFDDGKFAYHLMLQEFWKEEGHLALFRVFDTAFSTVDNSTSCFSVRGQMQQCPSEIPDNVAEFLEGWLVLAEKLVHPKNLIESTYALPAKPSLENGSSFDPIAHLKGLHKPIFDAVQKLWNRKFSRTFGEQIASSLLSILCHIFNGEKLIAEKESKKEIEASAGASTTVADASAHVATAAPPPQPAAGNDVNQDFLRQLMDMGFPRGRCVEALRVSNNVEQATEYLLAHAIVGAGTGLPIEGLDAEATEDEAVLQAIVMSLEGMQSQGGTGDQDDHKQDAKGASAISGSVSSGPSVCRQPERAESLSASVLLDFTQTMLPGCLQMLDLMPSMVFKVKELLVIVAARNGVSWRAHMLKELTLEMCGTGTQLVAAFANDWSTQKFEESREYLANNSASIKLGVRMHLFSLLLQDMEAACMDMLRHSGFVDVALALLEASEHGIAKSAGTPRWLAPIMLILDQYERTATVNQRKHVLSKVLAGSSTWKWFDDRYGRWCTYNAASNKLIDAAYRAGDPHVRFNAGRRKYIVQFCNMLQLNEETGSRRPVMLCLPTKEEKEKHAKELGNAMDTDKDYILDGLQSHQIVKLIKVAVRLISVPVDAEALHAIMRLCLRYTRDACFAREFANLGGCTQLLRLTQSSAFVGFTSLATLLFRHVLEEDYQVLQVAAEQVVQEASLGLSSGMSGVAATSTGAREINYVLRQLGPAACRNSEVLKNAVIKILRLSPAMNTPNDSSWTTAQQPVDLVKAVLPNDVVLSAPTPGSVFAKIITELLDSLTAPVRALALTGSAAETVMSAGSTEILASAKDDLPTQKGSASQCTRQPNLLSKADILRMLAEFVLSYPVCADLIVQHNYTCTSLDDSRHDASVAPCRGLESPDGLSSPGIGAAELGTTAGRISEPASTSSRLILAYLLDHLLCTPASTGSNSSSDKDCGPLTHVLFAALATSSYSIEAQTALVCELKAAFQRALGEPESSPDKYLRIQSLATLTSTLLDACTALPNGGQVARNMAGAKTGSLAALVRQPGLHPIIRLLIKKGIMADLAKVPHSIELSSPSVVPTVNAVLKPLETLTRIVNQPHLVCSLTDERKKMSTRNDVPATGAGEGAVPSANAAAMHAANSDFVEAVAGSDGVNTPELPVNSSAISHGDAATSASPAQAGIDWHPGTDLVATAGTAGASDFDDDEVVLQVDELVVPHDTVEENAEEPSRRERRNSFERHTQAAFEQALEEILSRGVSEEDVDEQEDLAHGDNREANDQAVGGATSTHSTSEDEDGGGAAGRDGGQHPRSGSSHSYMQGERDEQEDDTIHGESGNENEDDIDEDDEDEEDGGDDDEESDDEHAAYEEEPDEEDEGSLADILGMDDRDDDFASHLDGLGLQGYSQRMVGPHFVLGNATAHVRAFELPLTMHDVDLRNDDHLGTVVPPAPSSVPVIHPLMTTLSDSRSVYGHGVASRTQRRLGGTMNRLLGGRYQTGGNTWQSAASQPLNLHLRVTGGSGTERMTVTPVPAVVLWQRIFGSSTAAAEILHLTNAFSTGSGPSFLGDAAYGRRLMMTTDDDDHVRLLTSRLATESDMEDRFSEMLQDGFDRARSNGPTILCSIPSTLSRWVEESRVLDGSSAHDVITALKPEILEALNRFKQEELDKQKKNTDAGTQEKPMDANETRGNVPTVTVTDSAVEPTGGIDVPAVENVQACLEEVQVVQSIEVQSRTDVPAVHSSDSGSCIIRGMSSIPLSEAAVDITSLPVGVAPGISNSTNVADSLPSSNASSSCLDFQITGSNQAITTGEPERPCAPPIVRLDADEPATHPQLGTADSPVTFLARDLTPDRPVPPLLSTVDERDMELGGSDVAAEQSGVWLRQEGLNSSTAIHVTGSCESSAEATASGEVRQARSDQAPEVAAPLTLPTPTAGSSVDDSTFGLEGVDPSFLAALPEAIRQEVISEQLRLQRIQRQAREQSANADGGVTAAQAADANAVAEVSAEFLAALPPNIQEEVLAQQRAEQARRRQSAAVAEGTAEGGADSGGAGGSVDPTGFINSLPSALRQQVLADMDDSQVALLPPDLLAEAQLLRQELEERHRRLPPVLQDRLFAAPSGPVSLSNMLRQSGLNVRQPTSFWRLTSGSRVAGGTPKLPGALTATPTLLRRGKQLLDQDSLTCLLVLLFLHEPRLNVARLHRVIKNVAYHAETFNWIIQALLVIIAKTADSSTVVHNTGAPTAKGASSQTSWLSFGIDVALGCRANVFQVKYPVKKSHVCSSTPAASSVAIHPQAAQLVCEHALDLLVFMSKAFPNQFLPSISRGRGPEVSQRVTEMLCPKDSSMPARAKDAATPAIHTKPSSREPSFWDVLVRLDQARMSKKGKALQKGHSSFCGTGNTAVLAPQSEDDAHSHVEDAYEQSPFGQLMSMLSHPVVRRSQVLTDRLLKLLSVVSEGISDVKPSPERVDPGASASQQMEGVTQPPSTPPVQPPSTPPVQQAAGGMPLLPRQLQLAVEILTSKSCSEEGLEDATSLLLRLSRANESTRLAIIRLLLAGAHEIGMIVCSLIRSLLSEVRKLDPSMKAADLEEDDGTSSTTVQHSFVSRGFASDRLGRGVLGLGAPSKAKGLVELQLPSMAALTSKSSSQHFLLRLLKVIIQLKEKTHGNKKDSSAGSSSVSTSSRPAVGSVVAPMPASSGTNDASGASGNNLAGDHRAAVGTQLQAPSLPGARGVPMEVDVVVTGSNAGATSIVTTGSSTSSCMEESLSEQLQLDELWETLGLCLTELAQTHDANAVLVLQPAVEAFFLVHAGQKDVNRARHRQQARERREDQLAHLNIDEPLPSPAGTVPEPASEKPASGVVSSEELTQRQRSALPIDTQKFLRFAETHRTVLNQILRQSNIPLADGPFSVLVDHMKLLDFDVKRQYFKQALQRLDENNGSNRRGEDLAVHVRRDHVFEDSYRELFRRTPEEWLHRFYIVFEGEEGQDAGGLLREWYMIMSREIFNPNYALFMTTAGDRVTYTINPSSHYNNEHLSYFKFVGRIIAKAIHSSKLLECYFTRSFYKHITGQPVTYMDMEAEDYAFYQGLVFLLENDPADFGYEVTFSTEIQEFGVTEVRDLKPNGRNIVVTEENKKEYVKLVCQLKMTGAIRKQLDAFLEGFYDIIPKYLISIFNEQELELLISGLPTIDIDDLKANTEYHKYNANSLQIQWFWRALRSFDQAERARFLQFVTGTSKVPLQGFAFLEGMNGVQKFQIHRDDRSTDRLPCAHTCFNQLDLPAYETYDKLRHMLLLVINECSEGFGLA